MSINKVFLVGNLTRDPELKATQSGSQVLQFGIAVNDRIQVNGQWQDRPNFFQCVIFGNRAQALSTRLTKGQKVAIEGKLRYSQWQDQNGNNRSSVSITVDDCEFMSTKNANAGGYANQAPAAPAPQAPQADPYLIETPF